MSKIVNKASVLVFFLSMVVAGVLVSDLLDRLVFNPLSKSFEPDSILTIQIIILVTTSFTMIWYSRDSEIADWKGQTTYREAILAFFLVSLVFAVAYSVITTIFGVLIESEGTGTILTEVLLVMALTMSAFVWKGRDLHL